jgi:hypothetical protein
VLPNAGLAVTTATGAAADELVDGLEDDPVDGAEASLLSTVFVTVVVLLDRPPVEQADTATSRRASRATRARTAPDDR